MEDGRTRFHFQPLAKALSRAKMIVVQSPANPTGGVFAAEDLEQIVWWAKRRDVLVRGSKHAGSILVDRMTIAGD